MKPLIYLIEDDESTRGLFREATPAEFDVKAFADPLAALQALTAERPWVLVSDQTLPHLSGDEFLRLSRALSPFSIRVIQTASRNERLLLDGIRKSQLNDFILKPWTLDIMEGRMIAAVELYRANERQRLLGEEAQRNGEKVKELTERLEAAAAELASARKSERGLRKEIEPWAPPAIVAAIKRGGSPRDSRAAVATLAFSCPPDPDLPAKLIEGRPASFHLVRHFSDAVLKYGGWKDSACCPGGRMTAAYFGLMGRSEKIADEALAAALELKTAIENIYRATDSVFPCYIYLNIQDDVEVRVHTSVINLANEPITQKTLEVVGLRPLPCATSSLGLGEFDKRAGDACSKNSLLEERPRLSIEGLEGAGPREGVSSQGIRPRCAPAPRGPMREEISLAGGVTLAASMEFKGRLKNLLWDLNGFSAIDAGARRASARKKTA